MRFCCAASALIMMICYLASPDDPTPGWKYRPADDARMMREVQERVAAFNTAARPDSRPCSKAECRLPST